MFQSCFRISFLIVFVCFLFIGKVSSQTCLYTEEQYATIQAELEKARTELASTRSTLGRLRESVGGAADFCSGSMSGESGVFTSPNFPGNYGDNLRCTRYFGGSSGKVVQISFTKFNTEINPACSFDRVNIYIGGTHYGTYCGRNTPPTIRSYEQVKVVFFTDANTVRSGFVLQWTLENEPTLTFKLTPRKGNFDQAQYMCQQMNGRLVERGFQTNDYWAIIWDLMSNEPAGYWTGITDRNVEGRWQYLNGESAASLSYLWFTGEPNNVGNNEHCAVLQGWYAGYVLNDKPCSTWFAHGVCEIPS